MRWIKNKKGGRGGGEEQQKGEKERNQLSHRGVPKLKEHNNGHILKTNLHHHVLFLSPQAQISQAADPLSRVSTVIRNMHHIPLNPQTEHTRRLLGASMPHQISPNQLRSCKQPCSVICELYKNIKSNDKFLHRMKSTVWKYSKYLLL